MTQQALEDAQIYEILGEEGFASFVTAFYRRVRTDDLLGPMYPQEDWEGAEQRLRDFLVFRFGGPRRYIEERGHPRLRMRHMPFPIDIAARDRWFFHMEDALDETISHEDAKSHLLAFFAHVANFLRNRPEP